MQNKISETLDFLYSKTAISPEILIILGSGSGSALDRIAKESVVPYSDVPHFAKTTAHSHSGNLIFGTIADRKVMVMQGRFHVYEGYAPSVTTYPVCVAAHMGANILITTNLSGGINPGFRVGDFMVVEDHINMSGTSPLIWDKDATGRKYVDMHDAYSPGLIRAFEKSAGRLGLQFHRGVLAYLTGPSFETRAELRMLKMIGADAIGWSIVPEVLEARRYDMEAFGLSCISDLSDPDKFDNVDLDRLYKTGEERATVLSSLLTGFISALNEN